MLNSPLPNFRKIFVENSLTHNMVVEAVSRTVMVKPFLGKAPKFSLSRSQFPDDLSAPEDHLSFQPLQTFCLTHVSQGDPLRF